MRPAADVLHSLLLLTPIACAAAAAADLPDPCVAPKERIFASVIKALMVGQVIPSGSIVDAGANDGREACFYASLDPQRIVHAIDPLRLNVASIHIARRRYPTIQPMLGGLGREARVLHVPQKKSLNVGQQISFAPTESTVPRDISGTRTHNVLRFQGNTTESLWQPFPVDRLDTHFATRWASERLGFAHFDTEGNELDVLVGAAATLRRDGPVFTIEVSVQKNPAFTTQLLDYVEQLGYDALLVEEECGTPLDCRNVVAVPRQRSGLLAAALAVLGAHVRKGQLVHVNSTTILDHGYLCCRQGRACCPNARTCCAPWHVTKFTTRLPIDARTDDCPRAPKPKLAHECAAQAKEIRHAQARIDDGRLRPSKPGFRP